jgi:hypothetical protein
MPDNVVIPITATQNVSTVEISTLNGAPCALQQVQRQSLAVLQPGGAANDVSRSNPLPVSISDVAVSPPVVSVFAATTSATIVAANAARKGLYLSAPLGTNLTVRFGASTASAANCSDVVRATEVLALTGIEAQAAMTGFVDAGQARVTEFF